MKDVLLSILGLGGKPIKYVQTILLIFLAIFVFFTVSFFYRWQLWKNKNAIDERELAK